MLEPNRENLAPRKKKEKKRGKFVDKKSPIFSNLVANLARKNKNPTLYPPLYPHIGLTSTYIGTQNPKFLLRFLDIKHGSKTIKDPSNYGIQPW
jgi:hypothetical protein